MIERSVVGKKTVKTIVLEQLTKQFQGKPGLSDDVIDELTQRSLLRLESSSLGQPLDVHAEINSLSDEGQRLVATVVASILKENLTKLKERRVAAIVRCEANRLLADNKNFEQLSLKLTSYVCEQLCESLTNEFVKALEGSSQVLPETIALLTEMSLKRLESMLARQDLQNNESHKFSERSSANKRKDFDGLVKSAVAPLLQHNVDWIKSIQELTLTDKLNLSPKRFVYPLVEKKLPQHVVVEKAPTLENYLHAMLADINRVCGLLGPNIDRKTVIDCFYRQFQMGTEISLEFLQKIKFLKNLYTSYQEHNFVAKRIRQECAAELAPLQKTLDLSKEEESRVEGFCEGLTEAASKKILATKREAYAVIRGDIETQMLQVENNRDQRLAEEQAKVQPAIDLLNSLYDCAAKIYVTNKVYQKQPIFEKHLELQSRLRGGATRQVERTISKNQSAGEKEQAIKLTISKFKKQLFAKEEFPKNILREEHDKCLSIVDEIIALRDTHNALAMPRDIYIDEEVTANFHSIEESLEYDVLAATLPGNPVAILHSDAEMQRFTKVVTQLAKDGTALARDPQKKEKGNALIELSATLTTEATNHYKAVRLAENVPGNAVQMLRDAFKARVAAKFDETYNNPLVGHHCDDWKKIRVKFMNFLFFAFLPLKKLVTNTWFFQPTTNTQDIVAETKSQMTQVLGG